jgi:hypothetical protein
MPQANQTRLLPALLLLSACLSHPTAADDATDEVIGTVGALEVRSSEVRRHLESLGEPEREALANDPAAFSQYLRALLVQKLVLREAMAAGWDKSAAVAERMALLRDGVVANTWIEAKGAPPEGYPADSDLAVAYDTNRESFLQPKSWRLAQIFVSAPRPPAGEPEPGPASEKVRRLAAALKEDPNAFAKLAAEESEESLSAGAGGEIGWLPEPRVHPDIRAVLPGLKLGAISEPVRMDDGWHIVRVLDIREPFIPTLEQLRDTLAEQLRAERARAGTEAYLGQLLREHPIAINEIVLSKLLGPVTRDP